MPTFRRYQYSSRCKNCCVTLHKIQVQFPCRSEAITGSRLPRPVQDVCKVTATPCNVSSRVTAGYHGLPRVTTGYHGLPTGYRGYAFNVENQKCRVASQFDAMAFVSMALKRNSYDSVNQFWVTQGYNILGACRVK